MPSDSPTSLMSFELGISCPAWLPYHVSWALKCSDSNSSRSLTNKEQLKVAVHHQSLCWDWQASTPGCSCHEVPVPISVAVIAISM